MALSPLRHNKKMACVSCQWRPDVRNWPFQERSASAASCATALRVVCSQRGAMVRRCLPYWVRFANSVFILSKIAICRPLSRHTILNCIDRLGCGKIAAEDVRRRAHPGRGWLTWPGGADLRVLWRRNQSIREAARRRAAGMKASTTGAGLKQGLAASPNG